MNLNKGQHNDTPSESTLIGYLAGTLLPEEKQLVENWLHRSVVHQQLLARMAFIYDAQQVQQSLQHRDPHAAFQNVHQRIRGKAHLRVIKKIAVAAAVLIGLFGLGTLFRPQQSIQLPPITVLAQHHAQTKLTLPDGTRVTLSAGSSLTYPALMDRERQVTLHGKGYFDVAPNAKLPFRVKVGDGHMQIHVLGTAFNIAENKEEHSIQTTLISGSIELDIPEEKIKKLLKPSEKAIYTLKNKRLAIAKVNTDRELDWLYNRLVFRQTPMKEVLVRLSHFYDVSFDVKNQVIEHCTFTGTFENKPLSQVLEYIKIASKINYSMDYTQQKNGGKPLIKLTKQR